VWRGAVAVEVTLSVSADTRTEITGDI